MNESVGVQKGCPLRGFGAEQLVQVHHCIISSGTGDHLRAYASHHVDLISDGAHDGENNPI